MILISLRRSTLLACLALSVSAMAQGQILNDPKDISKDFADPANTYFLPDTATSFDLEKGTGLLRWKRARFGTSVLFNDMIEKFDDIPANHWPEKAYAAKPELPFSIEFISPTTVRVHLQSSSTAAKRPPSIMLVDEANGGKLPVDSSWKREKVSDGYLFTSSAGSIKIWEKTWGLEIRDAAGKVLTRTLVDKSAQPFSFVRRTSDYSRSFSAVFSLNPGEKIFGAGESFTALDKRGQKLLLSTTDPLGTDHATMYKPVPFFLSSDGYGMFLHTSAPTTFDFGATNTDRNTLTTGDDELDLFIFIGEPKKVIESYTAVTGRPAMPPLWSFGLWMSRITYDNEGQTRNVAAKLRENNLPCDVIHLDTGWFETDWECDYQFAKSRFANPQQMIKDLAAQGFHISLWQLPYFIPHNRFFPEILDKKLAVVDAKGNTPYEDAVLDFSNPETVTWYQDKLAGLLKMGVGAIKTDFGEAAPYNGLYASGSTGFYEHNLYPLRYQKAAADITRKVTGDSIIWARAGWAGAQRNPVHWGGDSHKDFPSMAATLRAGISIGVSGYAFWSHDIGGFGGGNKLDVYKNWVPFGMLTSHSRVHGNPPKEPWEINQEFMDTFRLSDNMRYRLMPYIYAQAKNSTETGLPMIRGLFIEYPNDPGAWLVDDEYLFGSDLLVAPIFENATKRNVYLPGGKWIDYQSGKVYTPGWHEIEAGPIPATILVRDGAAIPHIALAQSTKDMDWSKLDITVYAADATSATGLICLPSDQKLHPIKVNKSADGLALESDPLAGKVTWTIKTNN